VPIEDDDWRLQGQERYLRGRILHWAVWSSDRDVWDHDHCDFCMAKIWDRCDANDDHVQYKAAWVTDDKNHWICPVCFDDFRQRFGWIVEGSRSTS
jgi:hypothetical protein